jgi:hypothetical protein
MSWGERQMKVVAAFAAMLALVPLAFAAGDERCDIPAFLVEPLAPLPRVTIAAKRDKRVDVLLLSGSPSQTGAVKGLRSYPAYFEEALRRKLPGLEVRVVVRAAPRRTVEELLPHVQTLLSEIQPTLVIWQAGTADAYRGVDADDFADALRNGVSTVLRNGADIVLIDMQYSPRTDPLIDSESFRANMRWVADTTGVPLFSRYEIMRSWSESGAFDFTALKNDGLFEKVHSCLGTLLAAFVVRGTTLDEFKDVPR